MRGESGDRAHFADWYDEHRGGNPSPRGTKGISSYGVKVVIE